MPTTILTQSERERYGQLPTRIDESSLRQFFYLREEDKYFIRSFYGPLHQAAIGLQIGIIRFLGYLPEAWKGQLSSPLFTLVTAQLGITISLESIVNEYGHREKTRTEHLQLVLPHIGFRRWQPMDELVLEPWLLEQGGPPMLRMGRSGNTIMNAGCWKCLARNSIRKKYFVRQSLLWNAWWAQ